MIIKPAKIGANTLTNNIKIDSITSKTIIPIITNAIVPKANDWCCTETISII